MSIFSWSMAVDALIVAIFLCVVIFFTKYGLDRAILKIGNAWLSFACALFIGPFITNYLETLFISDLITDAVHNSLVGIIENNANGYNLAELFANLPDNFVSFLDGLGVSLPALEAEFGSYTEASSEIIRAMAERIAEPCVGVVTSLIGSFLGFIIPWIFFRWLDFEIKKDRISFFRFFDHVGGFVVGAGAGYALALGIALLTRTAFQVIVAFDSSVGVMNIYNNSYVFRFLGEFDTFGAIRRLFETVAEALVNVAP